MTGVHARVVQRGEDFAGEAIVTDAGRGAFHAPFVAGATQAGGIDMKVARLRVFEKRRRQPRSQRVGVDDDDFRVSGRSTLKTPPKNSQAASHASIADAVVSSWVDRRSDDASGRR